ncbi:MAG: hypothetical protein WCG83_04955 [Candidatus Peregrinibacteria bacterium]
MFSLYNYVRIVRNDNFSMEFDRFVKFSKDPQYVFLGDSHPTFAIVMDSAHPEYANFAYPSENWRDMRLRAELALSLKPGIQYFVVPVDDVSLTSFRERSDHLLDMLHVASIAQIQRIYQPSFVKLAMNLGKYTFPLLDTRNRQTLRNVVINDAADLLTGKTKERAIAIDDSGNFMYADQKPWNQYTATDRQERTKGALVQQFSGTLVDPVLLPVVDDFFAFAASHHVQVIGVKYPVTLEYQQYVSSMSVKEVSQFYTTKPFAFIVDKEHVFDHQQEQFLDPSHLTGSGARLFTPLLMREIEGRVTPSSSPSPS